MLLLAGCSREQQDWRSAEAADTMESYGQFLQRHPESELATQARTRVAQLGEDRDWQHAGSADTVDAYRAFIAQHPNGKWAQEAHIRIDNFSLGEQKGTDAGTQSGRANHAADSSGAQSYGLAAPGEAASPAPSIATSRGGPSGAFATGGGSSTAVTGTGGRGQAAGGGATPVQAAAAVTTNRAQVPAQAQAQATTAGSPSPAPRSAPGMAAPAAPFETRIPGYGIQLGAFTTEAGANNEWHLLASRYASELQGLQEHVVAADMAAGRIYRLQAAVVDEGHARSICDLLRRRGQACVAVLPH